MIIKFAKSFYVYMLIKRVSLSHHTATITCVCVRKLMLMNRYEVRVIIYRDVTQLITPQPFHVALIIIKIIRSHAIMVDIDVAKCDDDEGILECAMVM